ncbi:hypothetical protein [Falsigemmobacter faecalis]|uniref:Uncharacterized protein n=1 Tax=Falsigemmobacter faecalis TaxID=2488730 RepID=A0A3P3D611_9RHOB|nr:hypothetical protein [Falsigemmobacter faecalis]RRH68852.1 hypothetical protein EG244_19195 [Falsigemmobacter faecalis]
MIERDPPEQSPGQQGARLSMPRSSYYVTPQGGTEPNLALRRLVDAQLLETPFFGLRQMPCRLRNEGHAVNEKRAGRPMCLMLICQKPNTSRPAKGHKTIPCLLRGLRGERPNQVCCADITLAGSPEPMAFGCPAANASRVSLSGGDHGLAPPDGSVVADIEH